MKRSLEILASAAAVVVMLGACQKEQINRQDNNSEQNIPEAFGTFTVKADYTEPVAEASTKTALVDGDSPYVKWLSTDKINMWEFVDGTENACFQTAQDGTHLGDNDKSATFDISLNGTDPAGSTYCYTAIYPEGAVTENGGIYSFEIPATQTLVNGNFAANADILIGKPVTQASRINSGTNISVQFKRPGTAVKLTLKGITAGEMISSVKITTAPEGRKIAGRCKIDLTTGEVSDKAYENGTNEITLICGNIAATGNDVLYFRCLDGTWASGSSVSIRVETNNAIYTKTVSLPRDYVFADGGLTKFGFQGMTRTNKAIDLSVNGTANCYIVSQGGAYKFKTVKGNTSESVGEVKGVKVLWETFGTATAPNVGDLIKADVSYADGYITFSTNDTYHKGNAVVAAYSDAGCTEGNVLWSWHIWLTDQPIEQKYISIGIYYGTMMDRNLGATSGTPGDVEFLGLLYQWGRKDPFLGASDIHSVSSSTSVPTAQSTISWPPSVGADATIGTVDYFTKHPTTFFNGANGNSWHSSKSQCDPCPPGWRVPSLSVWEFMKAEGGHEYADYFENSRTYKLPLDNNINNFYPATGHQSGDKLLRINDEGDYWTCDDDYIQFENQIHYPGFVPPANFLVLPRSTDQSDGYAVRCQKIE